VYEYLDSLARLEYAQGGDQRGLLAQLKQGTRKMSKESRYPPRGSLHPGRDFG
jgi:hypothetical protein